MLCCVEKDCFKLTNNNNLAFSVFVVVSIALNEIMSSNSYIVGCDTGSLHVLLSCMITGPRRFVLSKLSFPSFVRLLLY